VTSRATTVRRLAGAICLALALGAMVATTATAGTKSAAPATTSTGSTTPAATTPSPAPAIATGPVMLVHFDSAIDEVAVRYLGGALNDAADKKAEAVIIEIDTPGGAIDSMQKIVKDILDSPVPVVAWVAPPGSGAASAGTFLCVASSYLAMAPATSIGAAAPVGAGGENLSSTEKAKASQFLAALIRSLAIKRGRPAKALEATVLQARAYSAEEAVSLGIADARVGTLNGLLERLDGLALATSTGSKIVHTSGAEVQNVNMSLWQRLLEFLANPNLVFLLLSLGGLGLVVELWTGGNSWVPGALGVIFLLAAFAGLSVMPFSWAGLLLILFGILLLGFELHAPGHIFFGAAGTASMILGGIFLLGYFGGPGLPGYNPTVSLWLLVALAVIVGLIVFLLAREVHLSHHGERYESAVEQHALVGEIAEVTTRLEPTGEVFAGGEHWQAELKGAGTAEVGERVRVLEVKGFRLLVAPLETKKERRSKTTESKES
jgi:membrane-bound serine protease (ClpP class)